MKVNKIILVLKLSPLKRRQNFTNKSTTLYGKKDPKLKRRLSPVRNSPYKAYCKLCKKELIAGLSELKRHQSSKRHLDTEKAVKKTKPISDMIVSDTILEQVKMAELKMAAFVAEHNLPFSVMDHAPE